MDSPRCRQPQDATNEARDAFPVFGTAGKLFPAASVIE
jgi:hypothetical protein